MRRFRKVIFWSHLAFGVIGGIIIFIMSVTGALLAFEKQIIEAREADQRVVTDAGERLDSGTLLARVMTQRNTARPTSLIIQSDPQAAAMVSLGRDGQIFVNPYTGEITGEGDAATRSFFRTVTDAHRYLGLSGDGRPIGKAITGAANLVFLGLALSGLYIWFPRKLEWRRIRPNIWFRPGLRGKARNFNWHNTIGFWSSLILIILTVTGVVISYQWAGNLLFSLTGSEPPPAPRQQNQPPRKDETFVIPANFGEIWTRAETQSPSWRSISVRLPISSEAVFTIDEGTSANTFGRSTLTVDATSGAVTKWEPYSSQDAGRQLRSWFRFTHTGETGGVFGQFVAMAASLGGAFLVWTGFMLALRRLTNALKRRRVPASPTFTAGGQVSGT